MNILIFCQYYYPEQFLINEIAESLVTMGNKVTVLTGLPNYPEGRIKEEYKYGKKRDELINGVHVIRCSIIPRGKSKIKLILNYLSYMINATRVSKRIGHFDVVFLYQLTPITQAFPAIKYCRRNNVKLFSYNCDLAPMSGSNDLKGNPLYFIYTKFSKWAMNNCDYIGVTSKSFLEYNNKVNDVPYEKMEYLPQHASEIMLSMDMVAEENGIADFMFAGNIAGGTSIETIVYAVKIIKEKKKRCKIHIVGSGSKLDELKELVSANRVEKYFEFHGKYPMSEMPTLYKLADALLITLRKGQITVPSKLQAYMTVGKPIFGAMDGSGRDVIDEAKCGICTAAEDYSKLAASMEQYIDSPESFRECGENARQYYINHFTKKRYMDRLIDILQKLSQSI